jgi:uncharacterized protein YyaL (SSP411 family)
MTVVLNHKDRPQETLAEPDFGILDKAAALLGRAFDRENGGFGAQPKFPNP